MVLNFFCMFGLAYSQGPCMLLQMAEINPHVCGQIIFDKGAKNIQWRKEIFFNKQCWENWKATCKRIKLHYNLSPYTKINSKWIKDLNIRTEAMNYILENIGTKLMDLWEII